MTGAERLRTRLMVAAQKFANEIADAVLEANGEPLGDRDVKPARRRAAERKAPLDPGPVDPEAARQAATALAKIGIRRA